MIVHRCSPEVPPGSPEGGQAAIPPRTFALLDTGAPPGTRTPNPRIKPSHPGWSRWRENLVWGRGLWRAGVAAALWRVWLRGWGVWRQDGRGLPVTPATLWDESP